ncbi:hypothetical protein ACFR9U_17190 [Halorientalis brevis]|uniref:Uncharacterized protein n=1 Tax=Halorientalis brevis TaxID=1126241 RepID=A0ABD6CE97_9EURY|nr:hypothetical protein [Halorientalis brevis]
MPEVPPDALALCEPETVALDPGQKATITVTPKQSSTTLRIVTPAMSKFKDSSYRVELDGNTVYGPAALPPTDVDDMAGMWRPAKRANNDVKLIIKNLSSNPRTYHTQLVGWEE